MCNNLKYGPLCVFFFLCTCRLQLVALHHNRNAQREQATTKAGESRYKLSKPKYKEGKATVKEVKEDADFCKSSFPKLNISKFNNCLS